MSETPPPTFTNTIKGMFAQFSDRMSWRLDLGKYEDVKENASIIYNRITDPDDPMPPANSGGPLQPETIALFKSWLDAGCPE